jgi:hypothetical protein
MGAPKLSGWLDGKPPFVGLWQTRQANDPEGFYDWSWWNGSFWCEPRLSRESAVSCGKTGLKAREQRLQYRGHAQPSKEFLRCNP